MTLQVQQQEPKNDECMTERNTRLGMSRFCQQNF